MTGKLKPLYKTTSPVLIIAFNRADTVLRVLDRLAKVQPDRLYVAADGPRLWKDGESSKCDAVRHIFDNPMAWPCLVKTLFRTENLGCAKAVSSAISWFFEHEPQGIILEDDILPNVDFFRFCDEMLNQYKDDQRIQSISGWNYFYHDKPVDYPYSYYFSRFNSSWGWATWRRAWQTYDPALPKRISLFRFNSAMKQIHFSLPVRRFYHTIFHTLRYNHPRNIDTWDYQFCFSGFINQQYVIQPMANLTENMGFNRGDGTHTDYIDEYQIQRATDIYPLKHPASMEQALLWTERLDSIRIFEENLSMRLKTYIHFWIDFIKSWF